MFNPMMLMQMMPMFRQFQQTFQGDPYQTVQQMLNSGQMTQEQLNYIMPLAQQFQAAMMNGGDKNG